MRPSASIGSRLLIGALAWLALMMSVGGVVLTLAVHETVEETFVERLDSLLRAMLAGLEPGGEQGLRVAKPLGEPRFEQIYSGWYWQVADGKDILIRSRSLWEEVLPVHAGPGDGTRISIDLPGHGGVTLLMVERDLAWPGLDRPLHLQVAADRGEVDREVARFGTVLAVSLALMGMGLMAAVYIQVRYGLRPLRRLAGELDEVRRGVRARLGGGQPVEVAPLVEAMNGVLDHDATLIERARTHVGNLAHGLKTPLSILKAEASGEGPPNPAVVAEQVTAMDRLVRHHLARASAATASARALGAHTAVAPVLNDIRRAIERIHAGKALAIELCVEGDPDFPGERQDLEEMLGNLMDNACTWATGRVRAGAASEHGRLRLTVEDDGPGMSEADAADASRRGARLDEMVPGWGLGLAIVADLTALHGGRLAFGRSELGGLRVTVEV
ncbi:MAG: sensor histidine kinase [Magnetospirillum sp.]|nr:sensor histidine kinase [Magnetospirillum sp.]